LQVRASTPRTAAGVGCNVNLSLASLCHMRACVRAHCGSQHYWREEKCRYQKISIANSEQRYKQKRKSIKDKNSEAEAK